MKTSQLPHDVKEIVYRYLFKCVLSELLEETLDIHIIIANEFTIIKKNNGVSFDNPNLHFMDLELGIIPTMYDRFQKCQMCKKKWTTIRFFCENRICILCFRAEKFRVY